MPQKLTPLHDRILVRRVAEAESVRGGIIIPDTAKEKPQEGIVVAVGTGRYEKGQTIPLAVKDGDHVLFGKYAGSEIKIDGEELLILKEDEVFGILSGSSSSKGAEKHEKVGAARR
jgi:chaperonin GroES